MQSPLKVITLIVILSLSLSLPLISGEKPPVDILKEIHGHTVQLTDKKVKSVTPDLSSAKYIGLYFSAHWCPPCRAFTPELVKFYNDTKKTNPNFEIVFVSHDYTKEDMEKYMTELQMPWLAVDFSHAKTTKLHQYEGDGIPCLVIVDPQGNVLADSYQGKQYVGPHVPMDKLGELLQAK